MILPEKDKDWFENYSKAGKEAIRYNKILIDTRNNIGKKFRGKNTGDNDYNESQEKRREDSIDKALNDDNLDIFSVPIESNKTKKKNRYMNQRLIHKARYKYHDLHMKNLKKRETESIPSCTKYNPKYDSILRAVQSLPSWEKQIGRKPIEKKDRCDKFYIEHEELIDTMAGNAFIDMSKQPLKRRSIFDTIEKDKEYLLDNYSFINNNDIEFKINFNINENNKRPIIALTKEITKETSRVSNKSKNKNKKNNNNTINKTNNFSSSSNSANIIRRKIMKKILEKKNKFKDTFNFSNTSEIKSEIDLSQYININDLSKNNTISIIKYNPKNKPRKSITQNNLNDSEISSKSIDMFNRYYNERKKQYKIKNRVKSTNSSYNKKSLIKAPDFSKILSREALDKITEEKKEYFSYLVPDYSQIIERPKMLVLYSKKKLEKKSNRNRSAQIKGVNYSLYYDAKKAFEKVNNHSAIHSPNFDLMSSRPIDDDPLPSYMKNIIDRYGISQFSLNMNNYRNRGFSDFKTSFFPKQSFNNVVNLNLLKSQKFFGNIIFREAKKKFKKSNPLLHKIIRFYNRNFQSIMNEKNFRKFDGVTFKGS